MDLIPLTEISIWLIVKVFFLIALFVYIIFSLVVVKQVNLMIETLEVELEGFLKLASWAHLGIAIVIFIIALVSL